MFNGDNTFDGTTEVNEDVPEIKQVTKYYIDEVEEDLEEDPVKIAPV